MPRIAIASLLALFLALPGGAALAQCAQGAARSLTGGEIRRGHEIRLQDRLGAIDRALATQQFDTIVVGDSIVQQWPQDMLNAAFPGRRVLNAGVSGDGTQALLHRLASARVPATVEGRRIEIGVGGWERQRPRDVLVLIGTNDLRRGGACDVSAGIVAVAERLRQLYPAARIHVLGILPRGATQDEMQGEIGTINRELATRRDTGFNFIDASTALRCERGTSCNVARPPNFVHLTRQGYSILGGVVQAQAAMN